MNADVLDLNRDVHGDLHFFYGSRFLRLKIAFAATLQASLYLTYPS